MAGMGVLRMSPDQESPVVPSVGAVPVEVPCDLLEVVAKAIAETDDEDGCFDRVAQYDALTSEEREDFDRAHGYPHGDYEDCEYYRRRAAAGATGLDTAGIMRRFDQEISRSFDVIARMDMGRTGGSAATPTEPVDEVVCPNCQETIRARMSDQPEQEPIEDWPAVCPGCGALAPNLQLTNAPRCEHWFHRPPAAEQDGAVTEPGHA